VRIPKVRRQDGRLGLGFRFSATEHRAAACLPPTGGLACAEDYGPDPAADAQAHCPYLDHALDQAVFPLFERLDALAVADEMSTSRF